MTEQEQLRILKSFVLDIIRDDGEIGSPNFIYNSALNHGIIIIDWPDSNIIELADWLQPTPAEIDDIVKKGAGPV